MDDQDDREPAETKYSSRSDSDSSSGRQRTAAKPEQQNGTEQAWSTLTRHPLVSAFVAGLAVLLVGAYVFGIGNDDPSTPPGPSGTNRPTVEDSPDNAIEEIAARTFWATPPETFEGAEADTNYTARVMDGDVEAATPSYLIENAPDWAAEGDPVYLVGKIVAGQQPTSDYGIGYETRVTGLDRGFEVWIGTDDGPIGATGDVIYALGKVAARGETTTPAGRRIRTAYFLALGTTEADTVYLDNHGPAIREAARGLGADRRDIGLPILP